MLTLNYLPRYMRRRTKQKRIIISNSKSSLIEYSIYLFQFAIFSISIEQWIINEIILMAISLVVY